MEPLNSGVDIQVFDRELQTWVLLQDLYLEEAKMYRWKCTTDRMLRLSMQRVPLPMTKTSDGWEGSFETPFQCGLVHFSVLVDNEDKVIESYIYTDSRKMTEQQYKLLLEEILQEAKICFQQSGLQSTVSASGFTRECSMLQWSYIEASIFQLRNIFAKMDRHPLRTLEREELILRRERVKNANPRSISWMERHGQSFGATPTKLPSHLQTTRVQETYNLYENRVVLRNLLDLEKLLKCYSFIQDEEISNKAIKYLNWISLWKKSDFLKDVQGHSGTIKISQVFRKHPIYRLWYQWFQALYQFDNLSFDLGHKLALKDTFLLYEMWCYLQIIKAFREQNLLKNFSELFSKRDGYLFLNLAENKESTINLTNGAKLTYQKIIQINTSPYYSYTQRMIPDIVLEYKSQLFVLDPKYRIASNLPMALGEMHKYRDGILLREDDMPVVREVYILTPDQSEMTKEKDFYSVEFHQRYGIGALCFKPGNSGGNFKKWLDRIIN
ncbi:DUF2357 domain-containing protein [Sutcliffiella sp. NPDC057660]|uniref:DUF2357 domain-containing protein n=1 Tax=Sutcliffiella sp. NPDC057660 TaxID=3346199 RepID=UPI0036BEACF9